MGDVSGAHDDHMLVSPRRGHSMPRDGGKGLISIQTALSAVFLAATTVGSGPCDKLRFNPLRPWSGDQKNYNGIGMILLCDYEVSFCFK